MTVHNRAQNSSDIIFPLNLQTNIIAQMLSTAGKEDRQNINRLLSTLRYVM